MSLLPMRTTTGPLLSSGLNEMDRMSNFLSSKFISCNLFFLLIVVPNSLKEEIKPRGGGGREDDLINDPLPTFEIEIKITNEGQ